MFKKIIAVIMALTMLFVFASCKGKEEAATETTRNANQPLADVTSQELNIPDKKVAILVAAESQYTEDYRAAKELEEKYPDTVTVREYPETSTLVAGDPDIMNISKEIAADSAYGAIVYARATQYTADAIRVAKEVNPDIKTICIEPEGSVDRLAKKSDLILCVDWVKAANDIVAAAKEQGAEYFLMFSHTRHISGSSALDSLVMLYATAKNAFDVACEEQGISFVFDTAPDPTYSGGINDVNQYMREAVARHLESEKIAGKNVAVFSTDAFAQKELLKIADEREFIYISPSFPTAYDGLREAFEIDMPESIANVATYVDNAKDAVSGNAKYSIYTYPLASVMLYTAVYCAFDILSGDTTSENLGEMTIMRANDCAGSDEFTIEAFSSYANVYAAYCPAFEIIK